jgi:alcohol dehydrogenase class IV
MNFEFATATRIIFGAGKLAEAGPLAASLGKRALLVTGANPTRADGLAAQLARLGIETTRYSVAGEPTVELARQGAETARRENVDLVIALGGGSVIDAGKAIAALATNPGDPLDFLEVIGRALPLRADPLPFMALPTTAGTGAEVTRNAVLGSPEHRVKVSLRSPRMLPRIALVDPELTLDLPPALTAATGLDAFTQLLEPFVSVRANPLTDALCREGLARAARALPRAFADGSDLAARTDMSLASLFGGLALANAGLGAVHGFAGPLGGMFDAPHGAVCAALLAPVTAANLSALATRAPESPALARYREAARIVIGDPAATAPDLVPWLLDLVRQLEIPGLGHYGIGPADFEAIVTKASQASSMKGNPLTLTPAELKQVLAEAR